MNAPHMQSGGRYPVLRSLAILYIVGGGVAALVGIVAAGWALAAGAGTMMDRVIIAAAALVTAFFVTITALAVAELLKLFIDVEHNTRLNVTRTAGVVPPAEPVRPGGRLAEIDEETAEGALLRGH